jgi:hypothetical protein
MVEVDSGYEVESGQEMKPVEGRLCLLGVPGVPEVMRCVLLCVLEVLEICTRGDALCVFLVMELSSLKALSANRVQRFASPVSYDGARHHICIRQTGKMRRSWCETSKENGEFVLVCKTDDGFSP